MATQETHEGPTPNGGVRSVAYFKDANGDPAEKEQSVGMEVVEYDKNGKEIKRTYLNKQG